MRQRKLVRMLAAVSAVALLATACGGGEQPSEEPGDEVPIDDATDGEDGEEAAAGGSFSMYIANPESLTPMNSTESEGAQVLDALFRGLVAYDQETAEPLWGDESEEAVAESIESDDNITWTITLKDGWTFHDGSPVTAQSFADAWNYAAYGPNAMNGNYFMDVFEGYEALNPKAEGEEEAPEPETDELSGVTVVDDQTLEVTLNQAYSNFPQRLGYTVYYPVPESFNDDPDAFNEEPIGNGPYQMAEPWARDQYIMVEKYEDYAGTEANADEVEFRIYAEIETAYNDLQAGNLDIMDDLPPEQLAAAEDAFGDRFLERESSGFHFLGIPMYLEEFSDPRLRQALSMAIDREAIVSAIFNDTRRPADAMVSPVVSGYREGACGEYCEYDPDRAAELFEEAGGYDGTMTVMFNSGAGHEQWMEAVANLWRDNLGIEDIEFASLDWPEFLPLLDNQEAEGPFRLGWLMDYPSAENYLAPIHGCNGSSNTTGYCNEEVDELIDQGNQAEDVQSADDFYAQAEDLIIEDMPIIPLWFDLEQGAHSEHVDTVVIDAFSKVDIAGVTVNG